MAEFSLYAYTPRQRTYAQLDVDRVATSLATIAADRENAAKQESAVSLALAQMRDQMHNDESQFMVDYADRITTELDRLTNEGNYRGAINAAVKMAGKAAIDPAISGRIKANTEYQNFVKTTQARQDISQDIKDWALAINPYHYEDKYDKDGNVIGGTDWKPSLTPVSQIDFNDLLAKVKQMVFQENGGATQVAFTDANGNETSNPDLATFGVRYYKNGHWQGIRRDKLENLLESAIDNTPGARAAIAQDWQVANWQYDNLSDEDKDKAIDSMPHLFSSNGKKYSFKEYYNNRFGKAISSMSGMNYTSSIQYDTDYSNYIKNKAVLGSNSQQTKSLANAIGTMPGSVVAYDSSATINKAFGAINDSVMKLEQLHPWLRNNEKWKTAKADNNYKQMAAIVEGSNYIMSGEKGPASKNLTRQLRSNNSIYQSVVSTKNVDKEALAFNAALATNTELPSDNKYTNRFMSAYNKMMYDDTETIRYTFRNERERKEFLNAINLDLEQRYSHSIKSFSDSDGNLCLDIPKNSPYNYKGIAYYKDIKSEYNGLIGKAWNQAFTNKYKPFSVNKDGKAVPLKTTTYTNGRFAANNPEILKHYIESSNTKANNILAKASTGQMVATTKFTALPEIFNANEQWGGDITKSGAYNSTVDAIKQRYVDYLTGQFDGSQIDMVAYDDKSLQLSSIPLSKQAELINNIQDYIQTVGKNNVTLETGIVNGKVGLAVTIPNSFNKTKNEIVSGDINRTKVVLFGLDIPALKALENDTKFIATHKYEQLSQIPGAKEIGFDDSAIQFTNNGAPLYIAQDGTSVPINKDMAIKQLDVYEGYNQVKAAILEHNPNADRMLASYIIGTFGYAENTPAFNKIAADLINKIRMEE